LRKVSLYYNERAPNIGPNKKEFESGSNMWYKRVKKNIRTQKDRIGNQIPQPLVGDNGQLTRFCKFVHKTTAKWKVDTGVPKEGMNKVVSNCTQNRKKCVAGDRLRAWHEVYLCELGVSERQRWKGLKFQRVNEIKGRNDDATPWAAAS